jgi:hypothetical protein
MIRVFKIWDYRLVWHSIFVCWLVLVIKFFLRWTETVETCGKFLQFNRIVVVPSERETVCIYVLPKSNSETP